MDVQQFLETLVSAPQTIEFEATMAVIDTHYDFTPTRFTNGPVENGVGQNNGSCKIFAFGQRHGLTEAQTLACFGQFYRSDVLNNPAGTDHANIRTFIEQGWRGIKFDGQPLTQK